MTTIENTGDNNMSRKFKIEKKFYDTEYDMYKKSSITINEGVTVLVGCNGMGKTTLLHQMRDQLKENGIPFVSFDNLKDGGHQSISAASFYHDFEFMATALASSEGENIVLNLGKLASTLRNFIKTGDASGSRDRLENAFAKAMWGKSGDDEKQEVPNERWLLLDAVDSGLSVDNIVELKECLFKTILKDAGDAKIYIVVSGNEYEIARGENCFDVFNGQYVKFADYDEYRQFILDSRAQKDKRYDSVASND
jgi:energy-coupling factor transporter ATP-binding protein EcfA2